MDRMDNLRKEAMAEASKRGHTLGRFSYGYSPFAAYGNGNKDAGSARCVTCGASLDITISKDGQFHYGRIFGHAMTRECKPWPV